MAYVDEVDEGTEAKLKECDEECPNNRAPNHTSESTRRKTVTALVSPNLATNQKKQNKKKIEDPDTEEHSCVVHQLD